MDRGAWWHDWQLREVATRMGKTWTEPLAADVVAALVNPEHVEWDCWGLVSKDLGER